MIQCFLVSLLVFYLSEATSTACPYASLTQEHSACKPSGSCDRTRTGITEAEKQEILKLHNDYRLKVAKGEETRGNPGPQPSGSDILELVWNDELATVAQAWANTCPNGHDCNDCRKILSKDYSVGQNIYYQFSFDSAQVWESGIAGWYDEVADMPASVVDSFATVSGAVIGHYTQVVWGKTKEIGCGAIYFPCTRSGIDFPSCKTYVCNYGPAGNFLGNPIYTKGDAASACPGSASTTYVGLCL